MSPRRRGAGDQASRPRNTPLLIIFATVVVDLIGFGIVLPILPLWAERFGASPTEIGVLTAVYSLMQFLFAPFWGRLSDRIGRRPVILITLVGSAVSALWIGLAGALWMLFAARILNGISGASYSTAQAYVADVTTREERARGMGMIGAAFGVGFILGPALGAVFSLISPEAPFFAAAALAALNALVAWRLLPESLRPDSAHTPRSRLDLVRRALASRAMAPYIWLSFVATLAFAAMESTFALLGKHRFGYDETRMALLFVVVGVAAAVGQGFLVGRLVDRHGERPVMIAGLAGTALGLGLLAAAQNLAVLLVALVILGVLSGLAFATVTALISKAGGDHEQGGVLGVTASVSAAARIAGPLLGGVLFDHVAPGAPMAAGAALTALCLAGAAWIARGQGAGHPAPAESGRRSSGSEVP
ncbi:MAG: MFS transporter [Thermoleophilia bacterium]|nr:MFS transporter [Thermoleophilia bacterium]